MNDNRGTTEERERGEGGKEEKERSGRREKREGLILNS